MLVDGFHKRMHSRLIKLCVSSLAILGLVQCAVAQNTKQPTSQARRPQVPGQQRPVGRVVNADFNQVAGAVPQDKLAVARPSIPLKRPTDRQDSDEASTTSGLSPLVALVVVVLLIVAITKFLRHRESSLRGEFAGEVFDVLGKLSIDARNSVSLVRIGDKIIVVGVSQNGLSSLSEVTDLAEVERLTNLSKASSAESFNWFGWLSSKSAPDVSTSVVADQPSPDSAYSGSTSSEPSPQTLPHSIPTGLSVRELEEGGHVR